MFCHTCGAKNPDESRFCNMCGTPFVRASSPLDSTQVGVGGAFADAARAAVEAERARESGHPVAPLAHPPGPNATLKAINPDATPPRPSSARVDVAAPTELSARLGPTPFDAPKSPLSITSSTETPRAVAPGFGDPSVSIRLDAIGIQSARKTWAVLIGGGLALLLVGGGITYAAMRGDEPSRGTAHEGDPFEIGAPTPDVDFVSGSNEPRPTTPAAPSVATSPAARDAGSPSGTPPRSAAAVRTAPAPGPGPVAPPPSTPPSLPPPTPAPPPTETTSAPSTPPADPSAPSPEMELEMYSARVRYLVRRYYAGRAQSCFDQATAENPSLSGQVVVAFHVGSDGHVTSARVSRNTTGSDALGQCLAQQAQRWELSPPPSGEVDLSMPFSR